MTDQGPHGRLSGKRILVTGAAGGIGAATARRAAAEGARVVLVDIEASVQALAAEVGGLAYIADVTDPQAPAAVLDDVARQLGGLEGLANVAGGSSGGNAVATTDAIWDRDLTLNLSAPFRWARGVIPIMQAGGGGSIVNISSIAGTHALPHLTAYVTAKAGLLGLTRSIAIDFGPSGVRCNAICPGTIQTPGLDEYLTRNSAMAAGLMKLNFVERFGTPEDVAALCAYLFSDDSSFINGEDIAIDGGRGASSVGTRN